MKYFLIEIATGDTKIAGKAVYEYETLKDAQANFHSKLGAAMKSYMYDTCLLMVVNSEGGIYENYAYRKEDETVEE